MFTRRSLLAFLMALTALLVAVPVHAQLQVRLQFPRHVFLAHEPMIAKITITNLAGRDITLQDTDQERWFSLQIKTGDDTLVPPRDPGYHLPPLVIPAGASVARAINVLQLYPANEYAQYRIQTSIFFAGMGKYFSSQPQTILVTDGRTLWQQTVGVPAGSDGAGSTRTMTMLAFRQPDDDMLYVRVEDHDSGIIYGTIPLGRLINADEPQKTFDSQNQLHVLQLVGPKTYLSSVIGLNGELFEQKSYTTLHYPPRLVKAATGDVDVQGGQPVLAEAQGPNATPPPKLSDRPAGMPID
ncbi:MAG: hypothetical protein QM796_01730 [Chthoniobacteraceae bacterium]